MWLKDFLHSWKNEDTFSWNTYVNSCLIQLNNQLCKYLSTTIQLLVATVLSVPLNWSVSNTTGQIQSTFHRKPYSSHNLCYNSCTYVYMPLVNIIPTKSLSSTLKYFKCKLLYTVFFNSGGNGNRKKRVTMIAKNL